MALGLFFPVLTSTRVSAFSLIVDVEEPILGGAAIEGDLDALARLQRSITSEAETGSSRGGQERGGGGGTLRRGM